MQIREQTALDITIDRPNKRMTILWGDEHKSDYSLAYLRSVCPCANCDTAKHGGEPTALDPETFRDIAMESVEEVGRYALRFTWADGHDTGIFSYAYLRSKCRCGKCETTFEID
jgi:DUF971 family protein